MFTYYRKYTFHLLRYNVTILLFAFHFLYFFNVCNSLYARHTHTTDRMKSKIFFMDRELIFEAKSLIQNIRHFRQYYEYTPAFQLGENVYELRQQYARMIVIYKKSCKLLSTDAEKIGTFLKLLMEIQQIKIHIDKLVEQIIEWENNRQKAARIKERNVQLKASKLNGTQSKAVKKPSKRTHDIQAERYMERQKQISYLERKKLARAMSMGIDRKAAKNVLKTKKEVVVEGFDSDLN